MTLIVSQVAYKPSAPNSLYPFNLPNILHLEKQPLNLTQPVTFFVGDNGSGKTTLIEGMASNIGIDTKGGSKNFVIENQSALGPYLRLTKKTTIRDAFFFTSEFFSTMDKKLERYSQGASPLAHQYTGSDKNIHELSHGQGFKAFFENRFRRNGLYLLDEPETAFSMQNQIEFLFMLKAYELLGVQFIIATHSPIILSYPGASIYSFDGDVISKIPFEETEHFKLMHGFMNNYKRYQREIEKLT